jgi:hypothetical protein
MDGMLFGKDLSAQTSPGSKKEQMKSKPHHSPLAICLCIHCDAILRMIILYCLEQMSGSSFYVKGICDLCEVMIPTAAAV